MPEERVLEDVGLAPLVVKRLIEPEEVAELVAFLAGPRRKHLHGAAIPRKRRHPPKASSVWWRGGPKRVMTCVGPLRLRHCFRNHRRPTGMGAAGAGRRLARGVYP
jgi:hypothetical protein